MIRLLRTWYWRIKFRWHGAAVGKGLRILGPVDALLRDGASWRNIKIGNNVTLGGHVYIRLRKNGQIILDDHVSTGTEVWLVGANDAVLHVGQHTILGSYSIFNGGHGLKIGRHGICAAFVYMNSSDHHFRKDAIIQEQGFTGSPIDIGDDVWVGGHVYVGKGVRIGSGSVIGAGTVVVKGIEPYKVVVGNPARILKDRT